MEKTTKRRPSAPQRLLCLLAGLAFCLTAGAQVTIKNGNISVEDAFASVRHQTGVIVFYENKNIDKKLRLQLDLNDVSLEKALDGICEKAGLRYEKKDHYVLIKPSENPLGGVKTGRVTGRVTDENGEPMAGATVLVVGKKTGAMTDNDGRYSVKAARGDKLRFSFIGMESVERPVGASNTINVALTEHSNQLAEVEVVSDGYQALPKDRATGSFSTITSKELKKVPVPNVVQRLEGKIAGMKVDLYSGDRSFTYGGLLGSSGTLQSASSDTRTLGVNDYNFNIRGVNTLNGEQMPLIVVDGIISEMDISRLSPDDIENITVLKDAAAASIWGSRAANGVIVITTKKGKAGEKPKVSLSMSWMTQDKPDLNYLNRMSSADQLEYEKELVDKGIITNSYAYDYYSASTYYREGVRLALDLKNGNITQAEYDARAAELGSVDNFSQIKDYFMQRANSQNYNLSVSGGGNNSTYYYSASYAKENPYTKRNSGQRLTLNLSNSWKLFNWATLSTTFQGSFFTYKNDGIDLSSFILSRASRMVMPYENIVDADGNGVDYDMVNPSWTSTLTGSYQPWTYNYLDEMNLNSDKQSTNQFSGNINLLIPIYAGLSSSTTFAMERGFTKVTQWTDTDTYELRSMFNIYTPVGATTNSLGFKDGKMYKQNSDDTNWTFRQQFNFDHTFNGMHRINALAGLELRETNVEQSSYTLWNYNRDTGISDARLDYTYNSTYGSIYGYTTSFSGGGLPTLVNRKRRFLSYYANAAYTFMERYNVSASVRYDDYNNFGLDKKYRATPFYSFGAKWHISREKFMENAKWVNMLALRLTHGINGNISLSTYPFTHLSLSSDYITGLTDASISALANPALRWEKTYTTNLALDFSLLDNRLSGSIDYYHKRSRDLLYSFPFSSSIIGNVNNQTLTRNAAAINADGIDLNLNGVAFRNKDWDVNIGFNLAWNKNKVVENPFFKEEQYTSYYNYNPSYIGLIAGYSTDKLFAFRYAGLDENGQTLVYDENGETVSYRETITSIKALKCVGHSTPTVYGGFNFNIRWKQFTLYSMFTYQAGSKFFRPTFSSYATNTRNLTWDLSDDIARRWRQAGDEETTTVPGIAMTYNQWTGAYTADSYGYYSIYRYKYSDINVEKGDYIRWRQVSLSYDLNRAIADKLHIGGAQVTLSIANLGLIWKANKAGLDPDYVSGMSSASLPPKKAYTLSLNVNF